MSRRYQTEGRRPYFIRDWRHARGSSVAGLADRIGVSKATLSRIERGQQPYTQDTLEALAGALSCRPANLIIRIRMRVKAVSIPMDGDCGGYAASAVVHSARSLADDAIDAVRAMGAA